VVVLDPDGRVLLFRYDDPPPLGVHWLTPGGGIDDGESPAEAAARELREETGWTDVTLGPLLGEGTRPLPAHGGLQHETHFAARVDDRGRPVDCAGHEVDSIAAWRWWTVNELAGSDATVWPAELPSYLSMLIRSESGHARNPAAGSPT
jgi:8-oxo-dGTP pyrophosphatase MutT (NUDIX family)